MNASTFKVALRGLLRRKFFTFISLFGIAFTLLMILIGSALLDHAVGPHPPEIRVARSLYVTEMKLSGPHWTSTSGAGYGFLDAEVRDLPGAERIAFFTMPSQAVSYASGHRVDAFFKRTDAGFWKILDFTFLEGGPMTEADDRDANLVAVINASTRDRFFGGDKALGRTIEIAGQSFRVVGVVEDVPSERVLIFSDVWVPIATMRGDSWRKDALGNFGAIVLAKDAADFPALRAEFAARVKRHPIPDPAHYKQLDGTLDTMAGTIGRKMFDIAPETGSGGLSAAVKLRIGLSILAVLFMTLPAINLVNVNLSRILDRAPEIGVRKAFGATSRALVAQFVAENVLLTIVGGFVAAVAAAPILMAINLSGLLPYSQLAVNWRILGEGLVAAVFFGVLSGVYPAWRMSRLHPAEALRGVAS
ncbi:MAG TPA: ABC transporter permease [Candidatus Polarisedimenticolaceae bacterium]|nr:ABC transporter permease [Candidatus Polarisedimenticolaceae bacterium]